MSNDDDRVGYGRPPKWTQFPPGVSGNPKGRPKGARSLPDIISRELNSRVTLVENNQRIKIKKRDALGKRLVAEALKGTKSAIDHVLNADRHVLETLRTVASALVTEQDDHARESLARRIRDLAGNAPDDENDGEAVP